MIASPSRAKKLCESLRALKSARLRPSGSARDIRFAVRDRAGRMAVAVDSIRTGAQHRNSLPGDFGHARQHESGVASPDPVAAHRAAQLALAKHGDVDGPDSPSRCIASCASRKSAAFSTGQLSVELSHTQIYLPLRTRDARRASGRARRAGFRNANCGMRDAPPWESRAAVDVSKCRGPTDGNFGISLYCPAIRSASRIVVGSGKVGPDASADSCPAGTSLMANVSLLRKRRSSGEPAAFRGRKMLADGVDFVDGRAAGDERGVELLEISESDLGSSGCSTSGRAAAGN